MLGFEVWVEPGFDRDYLYLVFTVAEVYTLSKAREDYQQFRESVANALNTLLLESGSDETIESLKKKLAWTLEEYLGQVMYQDLLNENLVVFKRRKYGVGTWVEKGVPEAYVVARLVDAVKKKLEAIRFEMPDYLPVKKLKDAFRRDIVMFKSFEMSGYDSEP